MDALGKNLTYGIAVTMDGIMQAVTIILMSVLNATDVSSIQRTIISLDNNDTGLKTSIIFLVFM